MYSLQIFYFSIFDNFIFSNGIIGGEYVNI